VSAPFAAASAALTDPVRLGAVRRYEILDAPRDGSFDPIAQIAAATFDVPIATVSIVDADRVWFAASHGLEGVEQVGVEPGLCASAFISDGLYIVGDATLDPRTLDHPLVRGALGLQFYVAAPIVTADGVRLGTITAIDQRPRQVTPTQTSVLSSLATIVAHQLELRLAALVAVRAERELRQQADERAAAAADLAERIHRAAADHRTTVRPTHCQLGGTATTCPHPAELKVADPWGDSAWACAQHAEEALLTVPSAFLASEEHAGLALYAARRD
jgi:GAF domain-containing protein